MHPLDGNSNSLNRFEQPKSGSRDNKLVLEGTVEIVRTDYKKFVGLQAVLNYSAGTWTRTRVAQSDYVQRKTAADNTTIIGIDINEELRAAADKGLKLSGFDVLFRNTTADLDAHSVTLDKVVYTNSEVVSKTAVNLTSAITTSAAASVNLPVGQDADPQIAAVAVAAPVFNNTDDSKYIVELTVNAAASSVYDYIGLMLKFTKDNG